MIARRPVPDTSWSGWCCRPWADGKEIADVLFSVRRFVRAALLAFVGTLRTRRVSTQSVFCLHVVEVLSFLFYTLRGK